MMKHSAELRAELLKAGVEPRDQTETLAKLLGKSTQYIRARLNGKRSWMVDEAITISETYGIPFSIKYFA